MNKWTALLVLVLCAPAHADKLCDLCAWQDQSTSPYLGSYWPHDRGTFVKTSSELTGNEFYVFDLNATAEISVSVTAAEAISAAFLIYPDAGTDCSAGGPLCGVGTYIGDTSVASVFGDRRTLKTSVTVPPGRYLIRVYFGDAPYRGTLVVH